MVSKIAYDYTLQNGPKTAQKDFYNKLIVGAMAVSIVTTIFIGAAKQNTHRVVYESQYVVSNDDNCTLSNPKPSGLEVAILEPAYKR